MKFRFSLKVTLVCAILALGMLRASYWQYERHLQKTEYIKVLEKRVEAPIVPFEQLRTQSAGERLSWDDLTYRRVTLRGNFDFQHEMLIKNRRLGAYPGFHVLTPFKLEGSSEAILVSRGFIPLPKGAPQLRKQYQVGAPTVFNGLVKASASRRLFAPSDAPSGPDLPWVDSWLRVDISAMQKQIPYPLLPVYIELMEAGENKGIEDKIVNAKSGREEMFFLPGQDNKIPAPDAIPDLQYPVPVFDTVVPPGRHKGYVIEWAFMALITLLIGAILQLKRAPRRSADAGNVRPANTVASH